MTVSQKCQYALRAVLELAKRSADSPTTVAEIAEVQAIPAKFLELILGELRQGGFVESRRGIHGGYLLAEAPKALAVGEIIRFIDGPLAPVRCVIDGKSANCPLNSNCALIGMWKRARDAVAEVYDGTTFQDLIDEERAACSKYVSSYNI